MIFMLLFDDYFQMDEDRSSVQQHEQLIENHQQLLKKYYKIALEEDEDTDLSHEIAQIPRLITSYRELVAIQISE